MAPPAGTGGAVGIGVAAGKLAASSGRVDQRSSYAAAVPDAPSSPGAVHASVTAAAWVSTARRSAIAAGAVRSPPRTVSRPWRWAAAMSVSQWGVRLPRSPSSSSRRNTSRTAAGMSTAFERNDGSTSARISASPWGAPSAARSPARASQTNPAQAWPSAWTSSLPLAG